MHVLSLSCCDLKCHQPALILPASCGPLLAPSLTCSVCLVVWQAECQDGPQWLMASWNPLSLSVVEPTV